MDGTISRRPVTRSRRSSSSSRRIKTLPGNSSEILDEDEDDVLVEEDLNATEMNKTGAVEKDEDGAAKEQYERCNGRHTLYDPESPDNSAWDLS